MLSLIEVTAFLESRLIHDRKLNRVEDKRKLSVASRDPRINTHTHTRNNIVLEKIWWWATDATTTMFHSCHPRTGIWGYNWYRLKTCCFWKRIHFRSLTVTVLCITPPAGWLFFYNGTPIVLFFTYINVLLIHPEYGNHTNAVEMRILIYMTWFFFIKDMKQLNLRNEAFNQNVPFFKFFIYFFF